MPDIISLTIENHIGLITLNRPEELNTYTAEMGDQWDEAYRQCEADDRVRVIVVTAAGNEFFCAGADMSGGATTFASQEDMSFSSCPVTPAWRLKKPVIGALNGHAVGIGFGLALQFDFRFVAEDGKYGLLQVRRGVLADACSHWLLPRMVGTEKALELILLGRKLSGSEVFSHGLATACAPADQVLDIALAFAEEMVTHSAPVVMAMAKQLIWQSFEHYLDDFEKLETKILHHSMGKADAIEGGVAYSKKRNPQWQGSVNKEWPEDL